VVADITRTEPPPATGAIQRRTLRTLVATQVVTSIGVTIGLSVGALLAQDVAGTTLSGLASSAAVVGGALLAVPVTRMMSRSGRRPGLVLAYLIGAFGAALVVVAAVARSVPLLFVGMFLFGGVSTGNLQARYAAVDLAEPNRRGRQLSLVVWATTVGAVLAPNFSPEAGTLVRGMGLPPLAGPFIVSAVAFALAAVLLFALLRPDPLLTARQLAPADASAPGRTRGVWSAVPVVLRRPDARLGAAAMAVGHLVMVAVMTMTPVRLGEFHGEADVLRVVGLVLSLHIAGMYAFSPLVGWLTDRAGRRAVILGASALLLAACAVAGTAGHDTPLLSVGLVLLGLGWSGTMVAGSTLLSESVPTPDRPAAQGLSDMTMGLAGAGGGAVSGFVVAYAGYPVLTLLAALAVVPLVALALRWRPDPVRRDEEG